MFVLFNYYTTMEKLLNLLNEYESESWILKDKDIVKIGCDDYWLPCTDSYKQCIISKSYWFIDWLVKNDKIDLDKVEQEAMGWFDDESPVYWKDIRTARLIMMLSVSNNPISDLVYYLK